MESANGVYDTTKPWQSNQERLVTERLLEAANMSPEDMGTPLWRRQGLFPDRLGYETRALTVQDCFAITTTYGDARNDYSRVTSGTQSSSISSLPLV